MLAEHRCLMSNKDLVPYGTFLALLLIRLGTERVNSILRQSYHPKCAGRMGNMSLILI